MPDPSSLKVGDRVRFVAMPEEWSRPDYRVPDMSVEVMRVLIGRRYPSRVAEFDEHGRAWIEARIREEDGIHYHSWAIIESTGWRLVRRRSQPA